MLLTTCYLLHTTYYMLHATYYILLTTHCMLFTTCYMLLTACYLPHATCRIQDPTTGIFRPSNDENDRQSTSPIPSAKSVVAWQSATASLALLAFILTLILVKERVKRVRVGGCPQSRQSRSGSQCDPDAPAAMVERASLADHAMGDVSLQNQDPEGSHRQSSCVSTSL